MAIIAIYFTALALILALLGKVGFMKLLSLLVGGFMCWAICSISDKRFAQMVYFMVGIGSLVLIVERIGPLVTKVQQWLGA